MTASSTATINPILGNTDPDQAQIRAPTGKETWDSLAQTWVDDEYNSDWGLAGINAAYAYALGYTGKGVTVGVVDSGVYIDHPEFQDRNGAIKPLEIRGTYLADGYQYENRQGEPLTIQTWKAGDAFHVMGPYDGAYNDPHGTHVTGTIGAARDGTGMHGVAFDANVDVTNTHGMDFTIYGTNVDYNYFKAAYETDAKAGARAINTSWGDASANASFETIPSLTAYYQTFFGHKTYLDAMGEVAKTYHVIQVLAAGNDYTPNPDIRNSLPYFRPDLENNWLTVGAEVSTGIFNDLPASTDNEAKINFSDEAGIAKYWTVFAPGGLITSTIPPSVDGDVWRDFNDIWGVTDPSNQTGYTTVSGTSMAAPHATGSLAVIMQRYAYLGNEAARDVLLTTARHYDADPDTPDDTTGLAKDDAPNAVWGWGAIDLKAAMDGPGQFLGAFTVDMTAAQSDTWYNSITEDALIQRKGEDAAEQAAWQETLTGKGWDTAPPTTDSGLADQVAYSIGTARAQAAATRLYQGSLVKTGEGTLTLGGAGSTYSGGTELDGGALAIGALGAAGTGDITFGAGPETLILDAAAFGTDTTFSNRLDGLGLDDTIDFANVSYDGSATARFASNAIQFAADGTDYTLDLKTALSASLSLSPDGGTGTLLRFAALATPGSGGGGGSPSAPASPATPVSNTPTNNTPTPLPAPDIAFDPSVSVSGPDNITLGGTASDPSGIKGVELFDGTTDLGTAAFDPTSNTWSFTIDGSARLYTNLTAVVTANDGAIGRAASTYDLETGITGAPYKIVQTSHDATTGLVSGETYFKANGALFKQTSTEYAEDGAFATTTSGGSYFNRRPFFAYVDRFAPDGTQTEEDVFYKDGHQTVQALVPGATLNSIVNDTFLTQPGGDNTFVFTPGFGEDRITSFTLRGPHHDTISLPDTAQHRLGAILHGATTTADGDTVLHLNRNDTIIIAGVTAAQLARNRSDFTFHA